MTLFFQKLNFSNCFQFTGLENVFAGESFGSPCLSDTSAFAFNQANYNFSSTPLFSNTMNWNISEPYQWPLSTLNPSNYTVQKFNSGNWFNNFKYDFGNMWHNFSFTNTINNSKTTADRTAMTVDDIDYSIMGKDAAAVKLLRPAMQVKVYQMFKYAQSKGWKMSITSGYRSTQKQTYLYNEWKAGRYNVPVVAAPGTSRHEFGCAVDISVTCNGRESSEIAAEMGRYGRSIGLRWGGDWSTNKETWHFDLDPSKTPKA